MTHAAASTHAINPINLGDTITSMDALAQSGFSACADIAKRALAGLESSDSTVPHPEELAGALRAIWATAEQFGNDLNVKAEEAGHSHVQAH